MFWLWLFSSFPACVLSTLGVSFWGAVLSVSWGRKAGPDLVV